MTVFQKQCLLVYFGVLPVSGIDGIWGPKSAAATEELQRRLELEPDGIWGNATDGAVRKAVFRGEEEQEAAGTFWDHIRYWTREEFRCRCGAYHAPYCDGFPAEPDQTLVELLDDIRSYFGRPAHRSSGLRCERHNRDSGGVENSGHLWGKAMDFFVEGVSAEMVLAFAVKDSRCKYAYAIDGSFVHVEVW